jgi:RND family efflux transporter MFP subunit
MNTRLGYILFLFLVACSPKKEQEETRKPSTIQDDKPAEVSVKRIEYEDFSYELISNGSIAAANKVNLYFQSQDVIQKIYVKNGQPVTKGQKIAELNPFRMEIAMNQAKETLERAKLDLQDVLIGQGYYDTIHVPAEVMKIARIKSNYDQSLNNYAIAERDLKAATLYAPFDGVIANLNNKELNKPDGDFFCMVIDNRRPEAVFHVLESELPLVSLNDKVFVSPFSQPDYITEGRISEINPLIDKNGMVRVKAVVGNRENKLYEGMNVKIRIQRVLEKRLAVPKTAVVLRSNKQVIFTLNGNRASWVYVQTGQENSTDYVVTKGLNAGDTVIYEGNLNLTHDASVQIKTRK